MAAEMIYTLLRFGFFILIWFFIWLTLSPFRANLDNHLTKKARNWRGNKTESTTSTDSPSTRAPGAAALPVNGSPVRGSGMSRTGAGASAGKAQPVTVFRFLAITAGKQTGVRIPLGNEPIVVGRSRTCQLVLADTFASGQHARFYRTGQQWFVEDLNSTNGTFVDGQPLKSCVPLSAGVQVRIGQTVLELIK